MVKVTAGTPLPGIPDLQSKEDFAALFSEATANPAEFALLRPENMAVIFRSDGESDHKLAWDTGAHLPRKERELAEAQLLTALSRQPPQNARGQPAQ